MEGCLEADYRLQGILLGPAHAIPPSQPCGCQCGVPALMSAIHDDATRSSKLARPQKFRDAERVCQSQDARQDGRREQEWWFSGSHSFPSFLQLAHTLPSNLWPRVHRRTRRIQLLYVQYLSATTIHCLVDLIVVRNMRTRVSIHKRTPEPRH